MNGIGKVVVKKISKHGLIISSSALSELESILADALEDEVETFVDTFINLLKVDHDPSHSITENDVRRIVESLTEENPNRTNSNISIVNVMDAPYVFLDESGIANIKMCYKDESSYGKSIFATKHDKVCAAPNIPDVPDAIKVFKKRFIVISKHVKKLLNLQTIEELRILPKLVTTLQMKNDSTIAQKNVMLVGMIKLNQENSYQIDDLEGSVLLDMKKCTFIDPLIVQNSFIIVEGIFLDDVFYVQNIANPPIKFLEEYREDGSKQIYNFLREPNNNEAIRTLTIAIFSGLPMDDDEAFTDLKSSLNSLTEDEVMVDVLIFMGPFTKSPTNRLSNTSIALTKLVNLLASYSVLQDKHIVIMPCGRDPGIAAYPRFPFPDSFLTQSSLTQLNKLKMATNPFFIHVITESNGNLKPICISVMKTDLLHRCAQNAIRLPENTEDIPYEFSKFLLSQNHIFPLPCSNTAINWAFDGHLYSYPTPRVVICASDCAEYIVQPTEDIEFINPEAYSIYGKQKYFKKTWRFS